MPESIDTPTSPALRAVGVEKLYPGGVRALSGVDLVVRAGETLALIGESGCGKTTLLRMFNRMVVPTSGTVEIRGQDATAWDVIELRRSLGYVQQEGGLLPHWTVERNVALVPALLNWEEARSRARAREMLDLVGLDPDGHGSRYPADLSGGQRQRVAVARALAADPDIILLDEPFGALDAITRLEVQDAFLGLKARLQKTLLLVTHDLPEAFRLADRIAVLKEGRVLQLATPAELRERPKPGYVSNLVDHVRGSFV